MIDDEPFPLAALDGRRHASNGQKVQQVEEMMVALNLEEAEVNNGLSEEEWQVNID